MLQSKLDNKHYLLLGEIYSQYCITKFKRLAREQVTPLYLPTIELAKKQSVQTLSRYLLKSKYITSDTGLSGCKFAPLIADRSPLSVVINFQSSFIGQRTSSESQCYNVHKKEYTVVFHYAQKPQFITV